MLHIKPGQRQTTLVQLLRLSSLIAILSLLVACSAPATQQPQAPAAQQPQAPAAQPQAPAAQQPAAPAAPAAVPSSFKESPLLTEQTKAGKLPAVAERLPKTPFVVKPLESVGKYGGTWRTTSTGPADSVWQDRTLGNENLVKWDAEWKALYGNVAESFQASPDATEFTFKLREGMKWSDGQPFTADDILFAVQDVHGNEKINPGKSPGFLVVDGKSAEVTKVDQNTVKFKFAKPNGLFLVNLAGGGGFYGGHYVTQFPKHYLQQFHEKYNKTNLDQLVKEAGVADWAALFNAKGGPASAGDARWFNPDLPTMMAWRITTPFGKGTQVVAERNPFYFKVDTEGNQLPYIDRVVFEVVQDAQVAVLKGLNGELDMQDRHIASLANKAVFADNMQKGNYKFFDTIPSSMNQMIISPNLNHTDPVIRKIFQDKNFRIGLSHAINRQELIDLIWVSQGEPWQPAPRKETPWYNEKLAKQYTEFDLAKANEALDKVLPQKDGEGFRMRPDGKRLTFVVETQQTKEWIDALNLIQGYWKKVGIDMQVKAEDRSLFYQRKNTNQLDVGVWGGDGGLKDGLIEARWYFPFSEESVGMQAWRTWYQNPTGQGATTAPEEPPADTKKQMDLYKQILATGDEAKQIELMKQIMDIAVEQFYAIGTALPPNGYGIVRNNVGNVPKIMFGTGGPYLNPAPTNPSSYFFK